MKTNALTKAPGLLQNVPPDVMKLPNGTPAPLVNMALPQQAAGCVPKIFWDGKQGIDKMVTIPTSMGDEPGVGGGVVSGVLKGPAKMDPSDLSKVVKTGGRWMAKHLGRTRQNGTNANTTGIAAATGNTSIFIE